LHIVHIPHSHVLKVKALFHLVTFTSFQAHITLLLTRFISLKANVSNCVCVCVWFGCYYQRSLAFGVVWVSAYFRCCDDRPAHNFHLVPSGVARSFSTFANSFDSLMQRNVLLLPCFLQHASIRQYNELVLLLLQVQF